MFVDETKIFYVNGIPVTFSSIVDWWEEYSSRVPFRQRQFREPHSDEKACWAIARAIVKELQDKIGGNFGYTFSGNDEEEKKPVNSPTHISSYVEDPETAGLDWLNHNDVVNKAFEILEKKWKEKRESEITAQQERANFWQNQQNRQQNQYVPKPEPIQKPFNWKQVLGFKEYDLITEDTIKKNYRKEAMKRHPDHGGTSEQINELFKARDLAYISIGKQPP